LASQQLWNSAEPRSIWSAIRPFVDEEGVIGEIITTPTIDERLALLPDDLSLSRFEDDLSDQWRHCLDGTRLCPFLVMSAFWTVLQSAAKRHRADVVLVDVGPSLGAINRAALVASDHVVVPVAPDLSSLQGLRNLGPTLRAWRKRLDQLSDRDRPLPAGSRAPLGYVVLGHGIRLDRPARAHQRWIDKIPGDFHSAVLNDTVPPPKPDPYCLARLKHYHSLMPLAQEARKPVFALKPADGAFGGHAQAVQRAYEDFRELAMGILNASRASAAP
jgi:chromosome partitioning protein